MNTNVNIKDSKNVTSEIYCDENLLIATSFLAVRNSDVKLLKQLIAIDGSMINKIKDSLGYTLLHHAVLHYNIEIMDLLLDNGINIETRCDDSNNSYTALELSIQMIKIEAMRYLLNHGANPNIKSVEGTSLLCQAIQLKENNPEIDDAIYLKILQLMLDHGSVMDPVDAYYRPFMHIIKHENPSIIKFFIKNIVNLETIRNTMNNQPIFEAVMNRNPQVLRILLENGIFDVNRQEDAGTPINIAASLGDSLHVEILLNYGADINMRSGRNNITPLTEAVHSGVFKTARLLLHRGADISLYTAFLFDGPETNCIEYAMERSWIRLSRTIVRHLAWLEAFGEPVNLKYYQLMNYVYENFGPYYQVCRTELRRLRNTKLRGNLTIFDVFVKKSRYKFIRNIMLINRFKEECSKCQFPVYWNSLHERFIWEVKMYRLRQIATKFLCIVFDLNENSFHILCFNIVKYLDVRDLQILKNVMRQIM